MKSSIDVADDDLTIVLDILKKHLPSHAHAWVFGSRANGTAKKYSDLDLAIDVGAELTLDLLTELAFDFEESDLPYKVDIVDLNVISESFKKLIEKDCKLLV